MKLLVWCVFLMGISGCRLLDQEKAVEYRELSPNVVEGAITSDSMRIMLMNGQTMPRFLAVKLITASGTAMAIPVVTTTGLSVTFTQDKDMVTIWNAKTGLPTCSKYRIEFIP